MWGANRIGRAAGLVVIVVVGAGLAAPAAAQDAGPWPAPVPNCPPPAAGEHPRLFFRRGELPKLRERAKTPEGQALLKRLRGLLNGSDGETMPKDKYPTDAPFGDKAPELKLPVGAYSMSHAAGYGLLYQLTSDRKYAELGKQCFEWALQGIRDRDGKARYSFKQPTGALRAGPALGWYAVGYDLCYDGWDDAFRQKATQALQSYNEGKDMSLAELVRGARQHPGSNHWGMQVGGGALAVLALMNDPGVDMKKLGPLLEASQKAMIRNMTEGFGDGGFFAEGDGTGSMSSHIVFLSALQAWKTAGGQDFITPRPNAQWMALKWIFLSVPKGPRASDWFWPQRGGYPHNIWDRDGLSGGGYFGIGFGAVKPEQRPALLWFYHHHLKAADEQAGTPCDTPSPYPHHAVLAFINWPWGEPEQNPAEVLPRCYRDRKFGFYAFRNRWQDENDIVISVLTRRAKGNMEAKPDGTLKVMAFGKRFDWGTLKGEVKQWEPKADGSAVLQMADGSWLAVDFSKASGADGMLVSTGAAKGTSVQAGGTTFTFRFLTAGAEPTPKAEGEKVVVGEQTVAMVDGKLVVGK